MNEAKRAFPYSYMLNHELFSDDGGKTWFTNSNSREVIEFPYTVPISPKRYLVDEDGGIISGHGTAAGCGK